MKKLIFVLITMFMLTFCRCASDQPFEFTVDNINAVFAANEMPFAIEESDDIENTAETDSYIFILNNIDSEQPFYGNFGYTIREDGGRRVAASSAFQYTGYTENIISSLCEMMDISNSQAITDIISEKFNAGEYTQTYDFAVDIEFEYDTYYIKAQLDKDNPQQELVSLIIENEIYYQWITREQERTRQELFDKYPLYYTQQKWDVPPAKSLEEINNAFITENIPFTVNDIDTTVSDLGFTNYTYEVYDENNQWVGHISERHLISGKYVDFMYITLAETEYYKQPQAEDYPVRAAAAAFGSVDDIQGLEQKVNEFLSGNYYSFSPERFIKHGDIYCEVTTHNDYDTEQEYLISITLYEPDALKAVLSRTIETSENDKQVYDKFFG